MLNRTHLFTSYIGRDEYRDRVFVTAESEPISRDAARTVEHEPIPRGTHALSFTGWTLRYRTNSWASGGQIRDALVGMTEIAPGWTEADVASLRRIWRKWHLSGMSAACAHMNLSGLGRDYDSRKHLVCPETGYRYGSAWLVKLVPAEVWAEVNRLAELPHGNVTHGNG